MNKVTQNHSRLHRYRHLNMSHFLIVGGQRGGGGEAYSWYFTVYRSSKNKVDDAMQFNKVDK